MSLALDPGQGLWYTDHLPQILSTAFDYPYSPLASEGNRMARGNGARGSFWGLSASLAAAILNLSGKSFPSHTDFAP